MKPLNRYLRRRPLLWLLVLGAIAGAQYFGLLERSGDPVTAPAGNAAQAPGQLTRADADRIVTLEGRIARILSDDLEGSRHQRFVIELDSGQTVLVAHNIDLAPRVPDLERGASIRAHGEFEWNDRGGVLHWTHHDPQGRHEEGWIEYRGRRYR